MVASNVQCWVKYFKDDNRDITDLCRSYQPRTITMECNKQKIDALTQKTKEQLLGKL